MILISGSDITSYGRDLFRRRLSPRINAQTELPERRSFDLNPVEYGTKGQPRK